MTDEEEEKSEKIPVEKAKEWYARQIAEYIDVDKEKVEDSTAVAKWEKSMKEFWRDPIEGLKKAITEHEEKIENYGDQIERNKEVIRKKRKMIKKYRKYILDHKKAINRIKAWIKNIELEEED